MQLLVYWITRKYSCFQEMLSSQTSFATFAVITFDLSMQNTIVCVYTYVYSYLHMLTQLNSLQQKPTMHTITHVHMYLYKYSYTVIQCKVIEIVYIYVCMHFVFC